MNLKFTSAEHRQYFSELVSGDKLTDAIYFLLGADDTLRENIPDVLVNGSESPLRLDLPGSRACATMARYERRSGRSHVRSNRYLSWSRRLRWKSRWL